MANMAQNNDPATFDEQGNQLSTRPPKINLRDADAIRRELSSVYRDMRAGRIDSSDGTKLAYVLDMIRKAYETGMLEERIIQLERLDHGNT